MTISKYKEFHMDQNKKKLTLETNLRLDNIQKISRLIKIYQIT